MTNYGKRGGNSPTAGKRWRTFMATAPDGSQLTLHKFTTAEAPFRMGAYIYRANGPVGFGGQDGKWYANGLLGNGEIGPYWMNGKNRVILEAVEVIQ
jgi:hypothetical protein